MRKLSLPVLSLVLFFALPAFVLAETECTELRQSTFVAPVDDIRSLLLGRMVASGCLGGPNDDWPLALTLDERLASAYYHADAAAGVMSDITQRARQATLDASTPDIAGAFRAAGARLAELTSALGEARFDTALTDAISWQLEGDFTVPALTDVDIKETFISTPCQQDEAACRAALIDAMELLRLVHVASRAVENATTRASELKLSAQLRENDLRWTAYFTGARSQFPHEIWLNSLVYGARADQYCDGRGGFCTPPAHQWILLHPSLAFEVVPESPAGNRVEPALVLEIAGYNRWRWEGSSMGTGIGASVIAIASDRADSDTLGYGVMVHYNHKWSLGVTHRNETTGLLLSYQLWNRSNARVGEFREHFTGQ